MRGILQDLTYAARRLRKSPGFSAAAIALLALGIGATTAVFSLIDTLLLRPPPALAAPDRLVELYTISSWMPQYPGQVSPADYLDYAGEATIFSGLAAFRESPLSLTGETGSERVSAILVSDNYFSVLGVDPAVGRLFHPGETAGSQLAVLSHGLWQRRFGGDPEVVGRAVTVNGTPLTVVGVTAPAFGGTRLVTRPEVFVPLTAWDEVSKGVFAHFVGEPGRADRWLRTVGRLAPGVDLGQARSRVEVVAQRLAQAHPKTNRTRGFGIMPLTDSVFGSGVRGEMTRYAGLLMAVVAITMLIACLNLASLLVARGLTRRQEIAIRRSLGASGGRVSRLLITESLLLALAGAAVGVVLAYLLLPALERLRLPVEVVYRLDLNLRVLGFALVVALLSGFLFGLGPTLRSARPELVPALRGELPASHRRALGLRELLVGVQVALALVIVVAAGLLVRTLHNLAAVDPGFDPERTLSASLELSSAGYEGERATEFYRQLTARLRRLPDVEAVGLVAAMPLAGAEASFSGNALPEGGVPEAAGGLAEQPISSYVMVGADFFALLGLNPRFGRVFAPQDRSGISVAVVNETLARLFWPGQNPLGRRLRLSREDAPFEVVGVVPDAKFHRLQEEPTPILYLYNEQHQRWQEAGSALAADMTLLIRTRRDDPTGLVSDLRRTVQAMDPHLPVFGVTTLSRRLSATIGVERQAAVLFSLFAVLVLILTLVGLYGILTHQLVQRTREIGIRMACGARPGAVMGLILGRGLALSLLGIVVGLAAAWSLARLLASRLYGVTATDPLTYLTAALGLVAVTLLISYLPAQRAARMDPARTLRQR